MATAMSHTVASKTTLLNHLERDILLSVVGIASTTAARRVWVGRKARNETIP